MYNYMIVSITCQKFYFTVNGSEDIDVLPNGLAIFSSVSNRGCKSVVLPA